MKDLKSITLKVPKSIRVGVQISNSEVKLKYNNQKIADLVMTFPKKNGTLTILKHWVISMVNEQPKIEVFK